MVRVMDALTDALIPVPPGVFNERHARAWRRAGELDSAWFEAHPQRQLRLRRPRPGEVAYVGVPDVWRGGVAGMLILQVSPGYRIRRVVYVKPPAFQEQDDAVLRVFWAHWERLMRKTLEAQGVDPDHLIETLCHTVSQGREQDAL